MRAELCSSKMYVLRSLVLGPSVLQLWFVTDSYVRLCDRVDFPGVVAQSCDSGTWEEETGR